MLDSHIHITAPSHNSAPWFNVLQSHIEDLLSAYTQTADDLFCYLHEQAYKGFTGQQFRLYRDNFFYRTENTVLCIAKTAVAAFLRHDGATAASYSKNQNEEAGEGHPSRAHRDLLEISHNMHAERIFDLGWQSIRSVGSSSVLLPECFVYRRLQDALFDGDNYLSMLGASCALEFAASPMLQGFYDGLFRPYETTYEQGAFGVVSHYFQIHLGGLEAEHAQAAFAAAARNCNSDTDCQVVLEAAGSILHAQGNLWLALLRGLRAAESSGRVIPSEMGSR